MKHFSQQDRGSTNSKNWKAFKKIEWGHTNLCSLLVFKIVRGCVSIGDNFENLGLVILRRIQDSLPHCLVFFKIERVQDFVHG
jgi:hypothetical protein